MNLVQMRKALAIASLTAMTACGGGGGSGAVVPTHNGGGSGPTGQPLLARIVGVGDSLTAGYQAGGILGATRRAQSTLSGHNDTADAGTRMLGRRRRAGFGTSAFAGDCKRISIRA